MAGGGAPAAPRVERRSDPAAVEVLLRALPDWFGIEESLLSYVDDAARLPSYLAVAADGTVTGALLGVRHFPAAAEVQLMAVRPQLHRRGVGRLLLAAYEADSRADGVRWLQVKTLGPSAPSPEYAATRAFYAACGFEPLEEIVGLWPGNPCLLMVKTLAMSRFAPESAAGDLR